MLNSALGRLESFFDAAGSTTGDPSIFFGFGDIDASMTRRATAPKNSAGCRTAAPRRAKRPTSKLILKPDRMSRRAIRLGNLAKKVIRVLFRKRAIELDDIR